MTVSAQVRARWAALGAAIAISLGAGGIGIARATTAPETAPFVAITPCRIADTRPEFQVGPRATPLGPNETYDVNGTSPVGECTDAIPDAATGLVLNVTAVDATAPTYLTIFPGGARRPNSSSLNPVPGAPPTPNAVTTNLSDGGFSIYNLQGSVHVIIDATGYYVDHGHDDRYYTKAEADQLLNAIDQALAGKADQASTYTRSEADARAPLMAAIPVGGRCSADWTRKGGAREGEFDTCTAHLSIGHDGVHSVTLVAQIGWGMYLNASHVKGSCRIERNGEPVLGSTITMGETVKTTEETNSGGWDNQRLNWAGITAISGPHVEPGVYTVACREIINDIQFSDISLSAISVAD